MTRKLNRNYSLIVVVASVAILAVLIAAAVRAQTSGAGRPSGQASAVLAPAGTSATAQAERPISPWTGAGSSPVSRSHPKRHGASPMDGSSLFGQVTLYDSGGDGQCNVAVADVNGDGKPDIVVLNQQSSTIGVLLGNGDGTFQPAVTFNPGLQSPYGMALADLNGDGKPDLVVSIYSGAVVVLLGNGDGTFQEGVSYSSSGIQPGSAAVADVNRDGKPDLIVANASSSSVGVLLGNGDGTFQPVVTYVAGDVPWSVAIADVNGDGNPDLLVADTVGSTVAVLLGNGDGTFQPAVLYGSGGDRSISVAVADVNGDGKRDVVVANSDSDNISVLLGNGDGTFQPAVLYDSGGYAPYEVAIADVNGDGKPDLIAVNVYNGYTYNISVLLGNGDGTFQLPLTYGSGADFDCSIVVADVNGDGKPDLVVGNESGGNSGDDSVGVLLNTAEPPTTTTLSSSLNPATWGQVITFTVVVRAASGTPTGTVILYDSSTQIGSSTLANGSASISPSLTAGSHSITAAYQGAADYGPSGSRTINQVVNTAQTTTSLASSVNPVPISEYVTYTATVTSPYGGVATGTATFLDGGIEIAIVTLTGNQAAYRTSYTKKQVGAHSITAGYSGDSNNTASLSAPLAEQVIKGFATRTVVTTSGSPSFVGQPVTFTATVTSKNGIIPDGELVTFYIGEKVLASVALAGEVAAYTTSTLSARKQAIDVSYPGDDTFEPSSGKVVQVVDKYPTTTALSSSLNPSNYGQAVTFTATVASAGPTPTGKVEFKDGTKSIGSRTMSGGVATLTTSKLSVGTHPITAEYTGDANSAESTSSVLDQVVQ